METCLIFALRLRRAWRYYTRLHYSWRLAWAKAQMAEVA
jgi:hypothetical protein